MSLDQLDLTTITAAILLGTGAAATPSEAARLALECSDESLQAIKARNFAQADREKHPAALDGIPRPELRVALGSLQPMRSHPTGATPDYADGWNQALERMADPRGLRHPREVFTNDEFSRGWNAAIDAAGERRAV